MTGEAIATTIEAALADCHLDPTNIRGQAYDGAGSMSGRYKGCAAVIQQKYPLAIYSHCCSHVLNLAVVKACSLIQVQNLFGVMEKVYRFFDNHPKRQYTLNKFCEKSSSKLKSLCKTRWLQRIDAFHIFMDVFDSIVKAFDHVSSNSLAWSRDSVLDAVSLSKAMLYFEFIINLHTVERYLSYAESLTRSLQARALDLVQAIKHIDTLKQVLRDARSNTEVQFNAIFASASRHAIEYDIPVKIPRCSMQTALENHPGDNAEEYYRRSLAVPFLDHLQTEINDRFTPHSITALRCMGLIPSCFACEQRANDDDILDFLRLM